MANPYFQAFKKSISDAVSQAAAATKAAVATANDVSNQVAVVAKDIAEDSVAAALGQCKALREYKLARFTAVGGAHNTWQLFAAKSKKPGALFPDVSVWVLDKKGLLDTYKVGKLKVFDPFFEQERKACSQLMRLKHPGVVRLIEPVEETRNQIVLVTEPVLGSLQCILNHFRDVPTAPEAHKNLKLSPLEIKHGLINLVECLSFLHTEAKMVHCSICPGSIYITADGSWKLSGFSHIATIDPEMPSPAVGYDYSAGSDFWEQVTKPLLSYVAPELVGNMGWLQQNLSSAADVFSLAAVAYELVTSTALIPSALSPNEYKPRVQQLATMPMNNVPKQLSGILRSMLSCSAVPRPPAASFASAEWFSSDVLLRALRFLDTILQRDMLQKVAFFKDLERFWSQMDARVLKNKVLPALLQEMRQESTLQAALPVCISICQTLGKDDFMTVALPAFKPLFAAAQGETLMALMRNMHVLCKLMTSDAMEESVLPLLLNALSNGSAKLQDEVVRVLHRIADDMSYSMITAVLPHLTDVSMRTTSLLVRTSCLSFMSRAVPRLGLDQANIMLELCAQITSVDKSAGTVTGTFALSDTISERHGTEVTAVRVLPLLCPLLLAPSLSQQQFVECTRVLREMIRRVETNRGAGEAAAKEAPNGVVGQAKREHMSWDTPVPTSTRRAPSSSTQPSSPNFSASTVPAPATSLPPSSTSAAASLWETSDLFSLKSNSKSTSADPAAVTAAWDIAPRPTPALASTSQPSSSAVQTPMAIALVAAMPLAASTQAARPIAQAPKNLPMNQDAQQQQAAPAADNMFGGLSMSDVASSSSTLASTGSTAGMQWPAPASGSMKPSGSVPSMGSAASLDSGADLFGGLSVAAVAPVPVLGPPPAPSLTIGGQTSTAPTMGPINPTSSNPPISFPTPSPSFGVRHTSFAPGQSSMGLSQSSARLGLTSPSGLGPTTAPAWMPSPASGPRPVGGTGTSMPSQSWMGPSSGAPMGTIPPTQGGTGRAGRMGGPTVIGAAADPFADLASVPSGISMAAARGNLGAAAEPSHVGCTAGWGSRPALGVGLMGQMGMAGAFNAGLGIEHAGPTGQMGMAGAFSGDMGMGPALGGGTNDMFNGLSFSAGQQPGGTVGMGPANGMATMGVQGGWGGVARPMASAGMPVRPANSVALPPAASSDGSLI